MAMNDQIETIQFLDGNVNPYTLPGTDLIALIEERDNGETLIAQNEGLHTRLALDTKYLFDFAIWDRPKFQLDQTLFQPLSQKLLVGSVEQDKSGLLNLPVEMIRKVMGYLGPDDLWQVAETSKICTVHAYEILLQFFILTYMDELVAISNNSPRFRPFIKAEILHRRPLLHNLNNRTYRPLHFTCYGQFCFKPIDFAKEVKFVHCLRTPRIYHKSCFIKIKAYYKCCNVMHRITTLV